MCVCVSVCCRIAFYSVIRLNGTSSPLNAGWIEWHNFYPLQNHICISNGKSSTFNRIPSSTAFFHPQNLRDSCSSGVCYTRLAKSKTVCVKHIMPFAGVCARVQMRHQNPNGSKKNHIRYENAHKRCRILWSIARFIQWPCSFPYPMGMGYVSVATLCHLPGLGYFRIQA